MKKITMMAASALMSVAILVGCGSAGLKDGSYKGEAQGHNGPIKVTVTVADKKISNVVVDEHAETPEIWATAEEKVLKSAIGKTSVDGMDTVSGATVSSNGIKDAIKAALDQAK